MLDTGAVTGVAPLESDTGRGELLVGRNAGEDGALEGQGGLTAGCCSPGLTCLILFLERPRPMDTRLKSVRWKAGLGE